ncbi:MAG: hypothetical protein ACYC1T_10995 [Sulfuricaulis sp.]
MCGGVKYKHEDKILTVYFPNPKAVLPVTLKQGGHELVTWGRRKEEPGKLPAGGWARLDSIKAGKWDRFIPKPVRLDVEEFMEKDTAKKSHWYPLLGGNWIQGLVAWEGDERRVYVVTIEPEKDEQRAVHNRWPRIMFANGPRE